MASTQAESSPPANPSPTSSPPANSSPATSSPANSYSESSSWESSSEDEYVIDNWPLMPDGSKFGGKGLLPLVRSGNSPFPWDVNLLIREVEEFYGTKVTDIPTVSCGLNNYGFHIKLLDRADVLARLARGDVNMPKYGGDYLSELSDDTFQAMIYELLRSEPNILVSRLDYNRPTCKKDHPPLDYPQDITGRGLFLFTRARGVNNVWHELTDAGKESLLAQAARIRASIFNFKFPPHLATAWLRGRLCIPTPEPFPPPAPTRDFCVGLFTSMIEATIKDIGEKIGWGDHISTVGPSAFAAKQSLLRFVPHMLPREGNHDVLYRLVLEHGDFGVHNLTIVRDFKSNEPEITSVYDWEDGCILPAILSDPIMIVNIADLIVDENGAPSVSRLTGNKTIEDITPEERAMGMKWSEKYFKVLFEQAPDLEIVLKAAKDARHLWFALDTWQGEDPEGFLGELGAWAETRMKELGVN